MHTDRYDSSVRYDPLRWWRWGALATAGIMLVNLALLGWFAVRVLEGRQSAEEAASSPLIPNTGPQSSEQEEAIPEDEVFTAGGVANILILGIDRRRDQGEEPTRSDVMMVLRVDFDRGIAKLLSFPRDIWLPIPGLEAYGVAEGRINQAYYYGEMYGLPGGGPALAMRTVELNFGIPIDHYVLVTFEGFTQIIDAVGGIDIHVEKAIYDPLYPTDDYGTMVLSIEPGWHHMDGVQALRYARTRHQDNDFRRVVRQQQVLLALRDKLLHMDALMHWRELLQATRNTFETDIPLRSLVAYGFAGLKIEREDIQTYAFSQAHLTPWTTGGGAHVWIPVRSQISKVVEQFMAHE